MIKVLYKNTKHLVGFKDSKRVLDRSQNFKMTEGKKISALLPNEIL